MYIIKPAIIENKIPIMKLSTYLYKNNDAIIAPTGSLMPDINVYIKALNLFLLE